MAEGDILVTYHVKIKHASTSVDKEFKSTYSFDFAGDLKLEEDSYHEEINKKKAVHKKTIRSYFLNNFYTIVWNTADTIIYLDKECNEVVDLFSDDDFNNNVGIYNIKNWQKSTNQDTGSYTYTITLYAPNRDNYIQEIWKSNRDWGIGITFNVNIPTDWAELVCTNPDHKISLEDYLKKYHRDNKFIPEEILESYIEYDESTKKWYKYTYESFSVDSASIIKTPSKISVSIIANYLSQEIEPPVPFLINYENPFEDAEPYFYGEGAPKKEYFLPIGEDNDELTNKDIKVQKYENNGFSIKGEIEAFQINGTPISYIKKGTFPIISNTQCIIEESKAQSVYLRINYIYPEIGSANLAEGSTINGVIESVEYENKNKGISEINFKDAPFNYHALEKLPSTLGFVIVGGGGGAGGISQYDKKANNSTKDQWGCGGSGGGGGEIVWGVLKLQNKIPQLLITDNKYYIGNKFIANVYSDDNETLKITVQRLYHIIVGSGGKGGTHGDWDKTTHKKPQYGTNGENGYDSSIEVVHKYSYQRTKSNEHDSETNSLTIIDAIPSAKIIAKGGNGGKYGSYNAAVSGGDGGSSVDDETTDDYLVVVDRRKGGKGHSVSSDGTVTHSEDSLEDPYKYLIYASKMQPNDKKYYISKEYENASGKGYGEPVKDKAWRNTANIMVPGGHSFGNGSSANIMYNVPGRSSVDREDAAMGGGGACMRLINPFYTSETEDAPNKGADGYFGIYY